MGQLLGSVVTATTARTAGRRGGSLHGLILVSSLLMYAAAFLSAKAKRPGVAPVKLLPASEGGLGTLSGAAAIRAKLGQVSDQTSGGGGRVRLAYHLLSDIPILLITILLRSLTVILGHSFPCTHTSWLKASHSLPGQDI